MKIRIKKQSFYTKTQVRKTSALAIKGVIKKPSKPVSTEDMNQAIQNAVIDGWNKSSSKKHS